jgi:mannitol-1-phosphate 5-dehydrogenase
MSQVVTDSQEIARRNLSPIVPNFPRAFLVEAFNRILVSKIVLPGFQPGITAFEEKKDLLPFEEAKLFGHNAIHAALGFIGKSLGVSLLADLRDNEKVMLLARQAFIHEIGAALVKKYAHRNESLFTQEGFTAYAEDLLERITNPFLADTVERAIRDPQRKLGENDRLFGAIRECREQGIEPTALIYATDVALKIVACL